MKGSCTPNWRAAPAMEPQARVRASESWFRSPPKPSMRADHSHIPQHRRHVGDEETCGGCSGCPGTRRTSTRMPTPGNMTCTMWIVSSRNSPLKPGRDEIHEERRQQHPAQHDHAYRQREQAGHDAGHPPGQFRFPLLQQPRIDRDKTGREHPFAEAGSAENSECACAARNAPAACELPK